MPANLLPYGLFMGMGKTMRTAVHSARLDVRVHPDLLEALETSARKRKMSRGELARAAIRQFITEREAA